MIFVRGGILLRDMKQEGMIFRGQPEPQYER